MLQPYLDKPFKLTISVTNSCNLRCAYCYSNCTPTPEPNELTGDEWLTFIDYLADNGFISVLFEGGEPLLRPDFLDIVRATTPKLMTWVRTNGTLVDEPTAQALKDARVATVLVDILGARASTHEAITGVRGSFTRAITGVRHLVAADLPVIMLVILNRQNVGELQDYMELAAALGVKRVGILRLYPLGQARENWSTLACSLEEMTAAIRALKAPEGLQIMQSWHPKNGNCCWENSAVSHAGDSIGCPYMREYVSYGNIREMDFLKTWEHPLWRKLRAGPSHTAEQCSSCSGNEQTRGGCRSTAYAFRQEWDAPDPFCDTLNHGVDLRVLPKRNVSKAL
jgi:radical SAM protein with 4Fe4S-binding SPASM domain